MNSVYQHEAIQQLAKEFGLTEITPHDLSEDEAVYFLKAIETELINPTHDSPEKWITSFFTFLRETGNFPEMLESPRRFARQTMILAEGY